ncbi:unnamed protein product [Paramecium pentaurelia]|uniref:Kelch motif family protein n=1 Tax=Paramecium pentaurelia TaxID=43138 RepID=A0A8S1X7D1_9CILI|nr:unnamed protein product [Paramecium pentaurelia]
MLSNRSNKDTKEVKRISLIPSRQEQQQEQEYKYIQPVKTVNVENQDPKWSELKVDGKNINHRAYTSITIHNDFLYLYGGYQVQLGIMDEFYRMNLKSLSYQWEKLSYKENPGPRTRHQMCTYMDRIYIFGGQIHQSVSTNSMWYFDLNSHTWIKCKINQSYPPEIDNHTAIIHNDNWIVFGGFFGGTVGLHSNYVYKYEFASNTWQRIQPQNSTAPTPRDGSGIAIHKNILYMFGGSNGHQRFNDLWKFDFQVWTYIPVSSNILPRVRSGHVMLVHDDKIIIFGGIHDITWELDDLFVFNLKKMEWISVDEDSARRKDKQLLSPTKDNKQDLQHSRRQFRKSTRTGSIRKTIKRTTLSPLKKPDQSEDSLESPTRNLSQAQSNQKTLDEKKRKEIQQKKMALLKIFEVDEGQKLQFRDNSPTSEKMRNSLFLVGNPKADLKIRQGKLTEFGKPLVSKFLQPLQSMQNQIIGKKPCARDGHSFTIYQSQLIIFGGDRHQMSFNDIYSLDLTKI